MAEKTETISKMEAVRRSLKRLGKNAKPTAIQADVRKRFGVEMSTDHVSTYKGEIAKKERQQKEAKTLAANKPQEAPRQGGPAAVGLEDILAVRELLDRIGAEHLRTLLDALV